MGSANLSLTFVLISENFQKIVCLCLKSWVISEWYGFFMIFACWFFISRKPQKRYFRFYWSKLQTILKRPSFTQNPHTFSNYGIYQWPKHTERESLYIERIKSYDRFYRNRKMKGWAVSLYVIAVVTLLLKIQKNC